MITSIMLLTIRSRHASQVSIDSTRLSSSESTSAIESRIPSSSSAMRTKYFIAKESQVHGQLTLEVRDAFNGQLDHEFTSRRTVVFDAYRALVLRDDTADNRQAQTGAALLGGKVGQEQLLLRFRGNARSTIG